MSLDKKHSLAAAIRGLAIGSNYRPGSQLPSRAQLEQRFRVSSVTLQRAMDIVIAEGFVETLGRLGTVLAQHPPHLFHYGLLLPSRPQPGAHWPRSWSSLAAAAEALLNRRPDRLAVFHLDELRASRAKYRSFRETLTGHRLAGLVCTIVPPAELQALLAETSTPVPTVAYGECDFPGVAGIRGRHDERHPYNGGLDYLARRGRRRLGLLLYSHLLEQPAGEAWLRGLVEARGFHSPRRWWLTLQAGVRQGARNAAELLFAQREPPDALLVSDDNAVPEILAGIQAAGRRVPQDVDVVVCGNFPWPEVYAAPIKRVGISMEQFVARARDYILACRRGEPAVAPIPLDSFSDLDFVSQTATAAP